MAQPDIGPPKTPPTLYRNAHRSNLVLRTAAQVLRSRGLKIREGKPSFPYDPANVEFISVHADDPQSREALNRVLRNKQALEVIATLNRALHPEKNTKTAKSTPLPVVEPDQFTKTRLAAYFEEVKRYPSMAFFSTTAEPIYEIMERIVDQELKPNS